VNVRLLVTAARALVCVAVLAGCQGKARSLVQAEVDADPAVPASRVCA
jgi:hypothetical protein